MKTTKSLFLCVLLCLFTLNTFALGKNGYYKYKAPNGKIVSLQRWGLDIIGQKLPIQLDRDYDTNPHFVKGIQHQEVWLYEYTKGDWMYFQVYDQIGGGLGQLSYKPLNRWFRISTNWNIYINEKGIRHKLIESYVN